VAKAQGVAGFVIDASSVRDVPKGFVFAAGQLDEIATKLWADERPRVMAPARAAVLWLSRSSARFAWTRHAREGRPTS
jgi:hypothetical protein